MCGQCARWGRWARPGTALGLFLQVFFGYGLIEELNSYTEPDPDDVTEQELAVAAMALRAGERSTDDEDDAVREARELRDSQVIPGWCAAVASLLEAADVVARYPWLRSWAGKRLDLKNRYAETLRFQAARLVDSAALITAAAADRIPQPEFPAADPAFAVLGSTSETRGALLGLWYKWHSAVCDGWLLPHEYGFLEYKLDECLGNKRKGREALRARARELLDDWVNSILTEAALHENEPHRLVLVTIPAAKTPDGRREPLREKLTHWEFGVLVNFTVAADWTTRTFLVRVPSLIAERLITGHLGLKCAECPGEPGDETAYAGLLEAWADDRAIEAGYGAFLPGSLDDTPVSGRRPVTLAEVRALRDVLDDRRQLFVVFSLSNGLEVLSLPRVEKRCHDGWHGILLAEAGDLPPSLIEPWVGEIKAIAEDGDSSASEVWWSTRTRTPDHPGFGEQFGATAGELALRRHIWPDDDHDLDRSLRVLALARGVHDLREIDDDRDPRTRAMPWPVWHALLATDHLDLRPFLPPDPDSRWATGPVCRWAFWPTRRSIQRGPIQ